MIKKQKLDMYLVLGSTEALNKIIPIVSLKEYSLPQSNHVFKMSHFQSKLLEVYV